VTKDKSILLIKALSKKLGNKYILKDIDLKVNSGEVIGITGKNGSGKTTLLRIIIGLMYPSKGEVSIEGRKLTPGFLGNLPTNVSALIENPNFLPGFTGFQNLKMLASIRNKINDEDIKKTIELVGLEPSNKKHVSKYSLGMKQRLGIAQAIMESPKMVLFDEPTNALDDEGVKIFSQIVSNMKKNGTGFIIVSHKKEDIDTLCDRVYRIESGQLNVVKEHKDAKWKIILKDLNNLENLLKILPGASVINRIGGYPAVVCKKDWITSDKAVQFLDKNNIDIIRVEENKQ
jgi:ABC-2 type transport system ATP-binding protein